MASNRLFLMVYLLLEKGTVTAPELAQHFEVSVRTIYRDINILSAAGIPVYATQGKGGGISISENFVLNKSLISESEQRQILMALQGMSFIGGENIQSILSKLSSIFQTLKQAIFKQKRISFLYYGARGIPADRTAEPLKLVFRSREWYLYAYCCLRDDFRLFKLTRIKDFLITEEAFERSAPAQVFPQEPLQEEPAVSLTLRFAPEMSYRVYDHFDHVTVQEDERLLTEVCLPPNEWLYQFLLSFGSAVEVLHPQSVRDEIMARINQMQKNYKT